MPYQYEYDKSLKVYSITIDLEMIGKDENFENDKDYKEASQEEKADRVNCILSAIENLSLTVKGNLDNAEPIFVVGGLCDRKTHYFENVVKVEEDRLVVPLVFIYPPSNEIKLDNYFLDMPLLDTRTIKINLTRNIITL